MPAYKCKIILKNGKTTERVIQSHSLSSLKLAIQAEGGFLVQHKKSIRQLPEIFFSRVPKIKHKELYSFNQEFLTLLKAGLPVVSILTGIIHKLKSGYFVEILTNVRDDIKEGESISNAFGKYSGSFSPLYIAMLRAGEAGGNIPDAVSEYLKHINKEQIIRQKIKAAATYPAILIACSLVVICFLLVYIVPAITGSFIDSGAEVPFLTRVLLSISGFVKSYAILLIIAIIFAISGSWFYLKNSETARLILDRLIIRLPFLGNLILIYTVSLFSSSLSAILKGGLPLDRSLVVAKGLVTNRYLQSALVKVISSVQKGHGFADSLQDADIFPDMAVRIVAAGEESGNLDNVLIEVASFYEKDVESRLTIVTSAVEPALMVIMGIIIGFILLAVYMPIFQMAGTIGY